jgi:hypothetical protein
MTFTTIITTRELFSAGLYIAQACTIHESHASKENLRLWTPENLWTAKEEGKEEKGSTGTGKSSWTGNIYFLMAGPL